MTAHKIGACAVTKNNQVRFKSNNQYMFIDYLLWAENCYSENKVKRRRKQN
jgi:hypothetical protein